MTPINGPTRLFLAAAQPAKPLGDKHDAWAVLVQQNKQFPAPVLKRVHLASPALRAVVTHYLSAMRLTSGHVVDALQRFPNLTHVTVQGALSQAECAALHAYPKCDVFVLQDAQWPVSPVPSHTKHLVINGGVALRHLAELPLPKGLVSLELANQMQLEALGPLSQGLERLTLKRCPQLTDLGGLAALPQLKHLRIEGCPGVERVGLADSSRPSFNTWLGAGGRADPSPPAPNKRVMQLPPSLRVFVLSDDEWADGRDLQSALQALINQYPRLNRGANPMPD